MASSSTIQPPEWLNSEFVESALRKGKGNENLVITSYSIEPATSVGDNYASQLFRTKVETQCGKKLNFIIKSLPLGAFGNWVKETEVFRKEARMLAETFPKIQKYLDEAGYTHQMYAKVLYWQGPPNSLIFMEDLKALGYTNANREKGLDLNHCKVVLESLAILHAGSLPLIKDEGELIKNHGEGIWIKSQEEFLKGLVKDGVISLAKEVAKWDNFPPKYLDIIKNLEETILPKLYDSHTRNDEDFNVLLHGDPWSSNFMFKYVNGQIESLKLLDFQLSCYNSPVLDLIYFIFSSPTEDIRYKYMDYFFETYHKKFIEVCHSLNIENVNYSLSDLKNDFKKRSFYGFVTTICVFAMSTAPPSKVIDLSQFLDDSKELSTSYFTSERFKKGLELVVAYLVENGVL